MEIGGYASVGTDMVVVKLLDMLLGDEFIIREELSYKPMIDIYVRDPVFGTFRGAYESILIETLRAVDVPVVAL